MKCDFCGCDTTERFCSVGCRDEYYDDLNKDSDLTYGEEDIDDDLFTDQDEEDYFDPDGEPADIDTDAGYDPYSGGPEQDEPIDVWEGLADDYPW